MPKKHICVVTGSRAEYGILKLLIQKVENSEKLNLSLLITGMHLLPQFGNTIDIIKKDNVPITKIIPMYEEDNFKEEDLGKAVGRAIIGFNEALNELKPDLVLVFGDRFEGLAAVIAAAALLIPIAHIHGGDDVKEGQVDKQIRHSITKFAHLHFPATKSSAERIKRMGEEEWRIHMVGSPSIDMILQEKLLTKKELCEKLDLNEDGKIILCVQHPYITEKEDSGNQMKIILDLLKKSDLQTVIIYPNIDQGSKLIIKEIEANMNHPRFKIFKNIERERYLSLLNHCCLMIGNSSSGIIEMSAFKLPVVNIGGRNEGREGGKNVINVKPTYEDIKKGMIKALSDEFREECKDIKSIYGDGTASEQIVEYLEELEINKKFIVKRFADYV